MNAIMARNSSSKRVVIGSIIVSRKGSAPGSLCGSLQPKPQCTKVDLSLHVAYEFPTVGYHEK